MVDYHEKNITEGITSQHNFSRIHPDLVGIASLHSFHQKLLSHPRNLRRMNRICHTNQYYLMYQWNSICMQSMFQPAKYLLHHLQPYYKRIQGKVVIGIHIRQGGETESWKDPLFNIHKKNITKSFPIIDSIIQKKRRVEIFVVSDQNDLVLLYAQRYGSRVFGVDGFRASHVGKHPTTEGLIRIAMELDLLSKCDYLFLTSHSGISDCARRMNSKAKRIFYLNSWFLVCLTLSFLK